MVYEEIVCASAILVNGSGHILFQQRDNNPAIRFPNYWAIPGGRVEDGEAPAAAIARELLEEIEFDGPVWFWKSYDFWGTPEILVHQHIYVGTIHTPEDQIIFHEGQAFRYLSKYDLDHFQIGYGHDILCKEYLNNYPRNQ